MSPKPPKKTEPVALPPKRRGHAQKVTSDPGKRGPAKGSYIQPKISEERWGILLEELTHHANRVMACEKSGISIKSDYDRRHFDPVYKAANEEAMKCGIEALEAEAHRRAHQGVDEPIYQGGALVGTKRVYSNTLIAFLLSANCPDKYRQRTENINMNMNLDLADRLAKARKRKDEDQS